MPNDPSARRLFVTSGGLKKIQELKPEPGSALKEHINNINACFPEEIVRYYTPGYSEQLLQRVDTYKPSDHTGMSFITRRYIELIDRRDSMISTFRFGPARTSEVRLPIFLTRDWHHFCER